MELQWICGRERCLICREFHWSRCWVVAGMLTKCYIHTIGASCKQLQWGIDTVSQYMMGWHRYTLFNGTDTVSSLLFQVWEPIYARLPWNRGENQFPVSLMQLVHQRAFSSSWKYTKVIFTNGLMVFLYYVKKSYYIMYITKAQDGWGRKGPLEII